MYQHILIALEGKPSDEAVIAHTRILAKDFSASVTLLRVITITADGPEGLGKQFQTEIGSSGWKRKNQAEVFLAKLERRLRLTGLLVETAMIVGDRSDADEIVAFADEGNYDLIVMAADSRPWWQRGFFGCPADGVLRKACVPILFIGDGTRRAQVKAHEQPPVNAVMAILGTPDL